MKTRENVIENLGRFGIQLAVGASLGTIIGEHLVYDIVATGRVRPTRTLAYMLLLGWYYVYSSGCFGADFVEDSMDSIDDFNVQ